MAGNLQDKSRQPDSRRCHSEKADGSGRCGNWAVKNSSPPTCSGHLGVALSKMLAEKRRKETIRRDVAAGREEIVVDTDYVSDEHRRAVENSAEWKTKREGELRMPERTETMIAYGLVWIRSYVAPGHAVPRDAIVDEGGRDFFKWKPIDEQMLHERTMQDLVNERGAQRDKDVLDRTAAVREDWRRDHRVFATMRQANPGAFHTHAQKDPNIVLKADYAEVPYLLEGFAVDLDTDQSEKLVAEIVREHRRVGGWT